MALVLGGVAALSIVGAAMAHPGLRIVDRADVLARALGITSEEVEQAQEDGTIRDLVGDLTLNELSDAFGAEFEAAIEQALSDGSITPEQAERLGELDLEGRSFGPFGGSGRFGLGEFDREAFEGLRGASVDIRLDLGEIYADLLGLTDEEYDAAREDGTLRDLIADLDPVAVNAAIVDARDAQIDAALAAGDITEEQAALLRDSGLGIGGGPFDGFGRHGHGRGGFGGPGGPGHFDRFHAAPAAEDTSASADASTAI